MLGTILGFSIAAVVACSSGSGDDGQSADANLTSATGDTLTPAQEVEQKLQGAWVNPGDGTGPVALIMRLVHGVNVPPALTVDRDTPHKHADGRTDDKGVARDRSDLDLAILTLDGKGGGTLKISEMIFDEKTHANRRNELYEFTLSGETLSLRNTSVTLTNEQFGQPPDAVVSVDGGVQQLRPPMTFHRQPAFCGSGGKSDCSDQFSFGTFKTEMPEACRGREELCLFCQPDHTCTTKVPSSCELARFTCLDTIEKCEFSDSSDPDRGSAMGEVTTIDPDGNPTDCNDSPTGKRVCCKVFGQKDDGPP
jgi:hypothetical protein